MGHAIPKQFLPLNGKPVIFHTINAFKKAIPSIRFVVVLPEDQIDYWKELSQGTEYESLPIALGGKERTDSVRSGLKQISNGAVVGIHDSVRPFVNEEVIKNCFSTAEKLGNAVPVVPVTESLRKLSSDSNSAVNRSDYRIVQTPQCFQSDFIKSAYDQLNGNFTDDASVLESMGGKINLIEGNVENIKITQKSDLRLAEALLNDPSDS